MADILDTVMSRPGMYLLPYDGRFHSGTVFVTFLHRLFYNLALGCPSQVDFVAAGPHFLMTATGDELDISNDGLDDLAHLFAVANHAEPGRRDQGIEDNYLAVFSPIVWFSEYCLIDIRTTKATYRQAFLSAQALGNTVVLPTSENEPNQAYFGFCFTLPQTVFECTILDIALLKAVMRLWKKRAFAGLPGDSTHPSLRFKWKQQDEHYYSLRIAVSTQSAPAIPGRRPRR